MRRVIMLDPKTRESVLFLAGVQPATGEPESGYVTNGDWHWSRKDGIEYAKDDSGFIRTQNPAVPWIVVEQPELVTKFDNDYDDLVAF